MEKKINSNNILSTLLPQNIINALFHDRSVRRAVLRNSHLLFFHFYFAHYVTYKTAFFHREFFKLSEEDSIRNLFIVAFRGSAKSTIFTMSYPLWAILGRPQKKFVLILCQTQAQAKQHMMNLRRELESNDLLKGDLGPFQEEGTEWGASSLVFSRLDARIMVASSEQSIRGFRHNQYRPDLIIGDDVEDLASVKTRDGRNKTYERLTGEIIPGGDRDTRLVIVGNLLHEDSFLMRIKDDIKEGKVDGVFRAYPLIRKGYIIWPGKYPDMDAIEAEKRKAGNEYAWRREFLLEIVPDMDAVIKREWFQFYDQLPDKNAVDSFKYPILWRIRIAMDLAISKKDTAHKTAIVVGLTYGHGSDTKIYVLKTINRKLNFPETVDLCRTLDRTYTSKDGIHPTFVIEDVGYQKALPQQLESEGIWEVKTVHPGNQDKAMRIVRTAPAIKDGRVLLPRQGGEEVINQLVHFGVEKYDDLADAFAMLVLSVLEDPPIYPRVIGLSR